jgi:hypothetical protein
MSGSSVAAHAALDFSIGLTAAFVRLIGTADFLGRWQMSEMIERVARNVKSALLAKTGGTLPDALFDLIARAAIAAMRESSDDLIEAGVEAVWAFEESFSLSLGPSTERTLVQRILEAAFNAALTPAPLEGGR